MIQITRHTQKEMAHIRKCPFWLDGVFYDHDNGHEYNNQRSFGAYDGLCFVGTSLFKTWLDDDGNRNWSCVAV